jgi:hypothetical protein
MFLAFFFVFTVIFSFCVQFASCGASANVQAHCPGLKAIKKTHDTIHRVQAVRYYHTRDSK